MPSGNKWPSDKERFERLKEAVDIIKKLWTEEWIDYNGKYYTLKDSNLYTKPQKAIPLYIAPMGPQTAKFAGEQGDGLITNEINIQNIKDKLLPSFKEGVEKSLSLNSNSSNLSTENNSSISNITGKNYETMTKAVFLPASYDEDKKKLWNLFHFGKVQ